MNITKFVLESTLPCISTRVLCRSAHCTAKAKLLSRMPLGSWKGVHVGFQDDMLPHLELLLENNINATWKIQQVILLLQSSITYRQYGCSPALSFSPS